MATAGRGAIEDSLKKKNDCEVKALHIVESLLDNPVDPEWMLDAAKYINQSHYQDSVEERALINHCGYPLCEKQLGPVLKQKYHISAKQNKVYDITERKHFCSNRCYKSSECFKQQLLTGPLWMRDQETLPTFQFYSADDDCGTPGDEICIIPVGPTVKKTLTDPSYVSFSELSSIGLSQLVDNLEKLGVQNSQLGCAREQSDSGEDRNQHEDIANEKMRAALEAKESGLIADKRASASVLDRFVTNVEEEDIQRCKDYISEDSGSDILPADCSKICAPDLMDSSDRSFVYRVKERSETRVEHEPENRSRFLMSYVETAELEHAVSGTSLKSGMNVRNSSFTDINRDNGNLKCGGTKKQSSVQLVDGDVTNRVNDIQQKVGKKKNVPIPRKRTGDDKDKRDTMVVEVQDIQTQLAPNNHVLVVERALREWCTFSTLRLLLGDEKVKIMLHVKGKSLQEDWDLNGSVASDPHQLEQYRAWCKKLGLQDMEAILVDSSATAYNKKTGSKPQPSFEKIQDEAKITQLKVRAYFQGKTAYEEVASSNVTESSGGKILEKNELFPLMMPLVDTFAQVIHRRRILLDNLHRVLPGLIRTFGVSPQDTVGSIRELVSTFNIQPHNTVFQLQEWTFLGIIFLKLLSYCNDNFNKVLSKPTSQKYLSMMLMGFQLDSGYLDRLVAWLFDLEFLLQQPVM